MEAITEITKDQYRDLECYIGRKNLITKVTGNEYKIDTASETTFSEGTFSFTPEELANKSTNVTYETLYKTKDKSSESWAVRWLYADHYLRTECYVMKGTLRFNITNTLITDIKSVRTSYSLKHKTYNTDRRKVNSGNYKSSSRVFSSMRSWALRPSSTRGESETDATESDATITGCLPLENSKTKGLTPNFSTPNLSMPNQVFDLTFESKDRYFLTQDTELVKDKQYYKKITKITYKETKFFGITIKVPIYSYSYEEVSSPVASELSTYYQECEAGKFCYQFKLDYQIILSTGFHTDSYDFWGNMSHWNTFHEISKIDITTKGLTVTEEEVGREVGKGTKVLDLQTNELMQSSMGVEESMFDRVARQIISAYSDNRVLVKFKLINNKLMNIDGEERYLRAGDVVKIKDGHDKYIKSYSSGDTEIGSDFEIIKISNKFEGFFYREVTAKEILHN